jgi:uncharacterized protein (TIGR00299 family) protein
MRIAYLDAFAGISGDMLLGACVQAGVPPHVLRDALAALNLGASLEISEVDRSGIHAVKVSILVAGGLAEAVPHRRHAQVHVPAHSNGAGDHSHGPPHESSAENHAQAHRSLSAIRQIIEDAALSEAVKAQALRAFSLLGEAEAKIHRVPLDAIHFHEVGSVDAISDIVLASVAAEFLQIDAWHCSPLNVGGGSVDCAHGRFPVPAPATAELLRGAPTYSSGAQMELVTPTGAALVRAFDCRFGAAPAMSVSSIGYGAGTRDPAGFANVLRLSIGEATNAAIVTDMVWVIEAAVDDLNPQIVGYVSERALALGALDVMCSSVFMKKNRPGTLITLLSDRSHLPVLEDLLLKETSTLGLRGREERRICLERRFVEVETAWGAVRVKVGLRDGVELNAAPEFEECRRIAELHHVPLKNVLEAALLAYRKSQS